MRKVAVEPVQVGDRQETRWGSSEGRGSKSAPSFQEEEQTPNAALLRFPAQRFSDVTYWQA